jgi:hypothetical protein
MTEEWKEIPKTNGLYEASTLGRIRSLDRVIMKMNRWGFVSPLRKKGRVLKPWRDCNGYAVIYIAGEGRREAINVHRLIASTYLEGSGKGLDVNHKDGNKKNNLPENLEWCTRKENMAHAVSMGMFKPNTAGLLKFNLQKRKQMYGSPITGGAELLFASAKEAAIAILGREKGSNNIAAAAAGKLRQAYGYFWKYAA